MLTHLPQNGLKYTAAIMQASTQVFVSYFSESISDKMAHF